VYVAEEIDYAGFVELLDWLLRRRAWRTYLAEVFAGGREPAKELSEALAIFWRIYGDPLTRERGTVVLEACAGKRARVAVLVASLMRNAVAIATDAIERPSAVLARLAEKLWGGGKLLLRYGVDAFSPRFEEVVREARSLGDYLIVVGIHCCGTLTPRVVEAAWSYGADRIMVVPCCAQPSWARKVAKVEVHGYWDWVYAVWRYLSDRGIPARVEVEPRMLSKANAVIVVER